MRQDRWWWQLRLLEKDVLTLNESSSVSGAGYGAELSALAIASLRGSGHLRLRVRGESMLPTLWPGDVVKIERCAVEDLLPGEIVLAHRGHRFFLHRFLSQSSTDGFFLQGDSVPQPDPEFTKESLLGRLVSRENDRQQEIAARTESRPVLPLRPWSRWVGQLLCRSARARSLALKLSARRKHAPHDAAQTKISTMDAGPA